MIENGMMGFRNFVPCAKAEELSIKNQGITEWKKQKENKEIDMSNVIIAIPD